MKKCFLVVSAQRYLDKDGRILEIQPRFVTMDRFEAESYVERQNAARKSPFSDRFSFKEISFHPGDWINSKEYTLY